MMRFLFLLIVALQASCSTQGPTPQVFEVRIAASEVEPLLARRIALQYLGSVAPYDCDGHVIDVSTCKDDLAELNCDYYVSHKGNGCAWGARVIESCSASICNYQISDPNTGKIICE